MLDLTPPYLGTVIQWLLVVRTWVLQGPKSARQADSGAEEELCVKYSTFNPTAANRVWTRRYLTVACNVVEDACYSTCDRSTIWHGSLTFRFEYSM